MMNRILVVAAHPDDEVLGCGGTIAKYTANGSEVRVAFLSEGVASRDGAGKKEAEARRAAATSACGILGVTDVRFGEFPDNRMDSVPLLDVVKSVEARIAEFDPDTVLTHHAGDLNVDHRRAFEAVMTACRPVPDAPVRTVLGFEVASSTEWQMSRRDAFVPNWFEDVSGTLERKLEALRAYSVELRPFPHPRSEEAVRALAAWRGATCGHDAAEAFMLGRTIR